MIFGSQVCFKKHPLQERVEVIFYFIKIDKTHFLFLYIIDDLGLSQMKCKIECILQKTIGNDGDDDVRGKSYDAGKCYEGILFMCILCVCLCIYRILYNLAHFKMK